MTGSFPLPSGPSGHPSQRPRSLGRSAGWRADRPQRFRAELGPLDDHGRELADRASRHLAAAGRRAAERGDHSAAGVLLKRAADLRPAEDRSKVDLLIAAANSLAYANEYEEAGAVLLESAGAAAGDAALETRVSLERSFLRADREPGAGDQYVAEAERAIPVLEESGDEAGLARAWWIYSWRGGAYGDYEGVERALHHSLEHARTAGDRAAERDALWALANITVWGPMPVTEGFALIEEVRSLAGDDRVVRCHVEKARSGLLAMSGDFDGARDAWAEAHAVGLDLGELFLIGFVTQEGALVELLAGDPAAAERIAREAYEMLDRAGNPLRLIASDNLAQALYELGRLQEAEEVARVSEEAGYSPDDPAQGVWRLTRGKILAQRGEFEEAELLAREGVRLLDPSQFLSDRGLARLDLAEVLRPAGRFAEAVPSLEEAVQLFELKRQCRLRRAGA